MTLEEQLRAVCAKRRIVALNLFPTASGWQASTSEDRVSWKIGIDADPVAAIMEALRGDFYGVPNGSIGGEDRPSADETSRAVLSEEDMLA